MCGRGRTVQGSLLAASILRWWCTVPGGPSHPPGKTSVANVPLEPPLAIAVWLDAGMSPVFRAAHRARRKRDSSTSSTVLRARYTYGLCASAQACERVAHMDSQYHVSMPTCVFIFFRDNLSESRVRAVQCYDDPTTGVVADLTRSED